MTTDQKRARKTKSPEELAAAQAEKAEKARLKAEAAEKKQIAQAAKAEASAAKKRAKEESDRAKAEAAAAKQIAKEEKARAKAEAKAKQETPELIAPRLLAVVNSQRQASVDFYPIAESRLIALAEIRSAKVAKAAIKQLVLAGQLSVCKTGLVLHQDLIAPWPNLVISAFELAIREAAAKSNRTNLLAATAIAAALIKAPKSDKTSVPRFAAHIEQLAEQRQMPAEFAWVYLSGVRMYFRRQDAEPALRNSLAPSALPSNTATASSAGEPPRTGAANFPSDFDAAFERLFHRGGRRSLIKALDLRSELPAYSPAEFDHGLRQLREADRYSMETDHGGYSRLSDAERGAGIQEGSSLFVFVKRK